MIDYFLLLLLYIVISAVCNMAGIDPVWILLSFVFIALPSINVVWKGAPYIPSDYKTVQNMLKMAKICPGETVIDLGCGDGRLVRAAHILGAKALGYEMSIIPYLLARWLSRKRGEIYYRNLWNVDLRQADVIFWYQVPRSESKFMTTIWPQLKIGCRVIVNTFPFKSLKPNHQNGTVYLYYKT